MDDQTNNKLYSIDQFSKMVNKSLGTLRKWEKDGDLIPYDVPQKPKTNMHRKYYTHDQYLQCVKATEKNCLDGNAENGVSIKKMGRKYKEIDKKQFENLCALQCTLEEISGFFEVDEDTLNAWCKREYNCTFSDAFKQKREKGKISLRRYQFQQAEKNPTMAIWLGKNYLDQTDETKIGINIEDLTPLADLLNDETE